MKLEWRPLISTERHRAARPATIGFKRPFADYPRSRGAEVALEEISQTQALRGYRCGARTRRRVCRGVLVADKESCSASHWRPTAPSDFMTRPSPRRVARDDGCGGVWVGSECDLSLRTSRPGYTVTPWYPFRGRETRPTVIEHLVQPGSQCNDPCAARF